ncbi:MAG: D-hexose-6-phosphate mutarotase [Myxococcales bacterium]|nr:D-hexose-6-phosphate mutarotase [Myxococcales bacterium]
MIEKLNAQHAIGERLKFHSGPGGLITARIETEESSGEITLHGGHVLSWTPSGQEPVLWMSESSHFRDDKAIRGGIPICWPWFGDHSSDPEKPAHGFARISLFSVERTYQLVDGGCGIEFGLGNATATSALWPEAFSLSLTVEMGKSLSVQLTMHNTSKVEATYGAALHSYLRVGDIEQVKVEGLAKAVYLDKVDGFVRKLQEGAAEISGETDRVYIETEDSLVLVDPVLKRRLRVAKRGSRTTVLWNPGADKARAMSDFDDEGYQSMLCIEAANAFDDQIDVAPGSRHTLGTEISIEES